MRGDDICIERMTKNMQEDAISKAKRAKERTLERTEKSREGRTDRPRWAEQRA